LKSSLLLLRNIQFYLHWKTG